MDTRLVPLLLGASALLLLLAAGLRLARSRWPTRPPLRLSRTAGLTLALLCLVGGQWLNGAGGLGGLHATLVTLSSLLLALLLGWYLPTAPQRAYNQRKQALTSETVDLLGFLIPLVDSPIGDDELFARYLQRQQGGLRHIQTVVQAALASQQRRRSGSVYTALLTEAETTGNEALRTVCVTLQHGATQNRRTLGPTLSQQRAQLLEQLSEAAKGRAQRLELLLIGLSAMAIAFGLLPGILYVMTGGGAVLGLW